MQKVMLRVSMYSVVWMDQYTLPLVNKFLLLNNAPVGQASLSPVVPGTVGPKVLFNGGGFQSPFH